MRKLVQRSIINPEFDFQKLGIGGLDREFSDIFRRAFSSRVFPSEYIEQLGWFYIKKQLGWFFFVYKIFLKE